MKKQVYNQPQIQVMTIMPTSIICYSAGGGGDAPGDTIGD